MILSEGMANEIPAATFKVLMPITSPSSKIKRHSNLVRICFLFKASYRYYNCRKSDLVCSPGLKVPVWGSSKLGLGHWQYFHKFNNQAISEKGILKKLSFEVRNNNLTKLTRGPPEFPYYKERHKIQYTS